MQPNNCPKSTIGVIKNRVKVKFEPYSMERYEKVKATKEPRMWQGCTILPRRNAEQTAPQQIDAQVAT
jgi:hypothetical protein